MGIARLKAAKVPSLVAVKRVVRLDAARVASLSRGVAALDSSFAYADYRTADDGDWSDASMWEINYGLGWFPAKSFPGSNPNTRNVTISHALSMDLSPDYAMHDFTIDTDGVLTDEGNTLQVSGDFTAIGAMIMTGTLELTGAEDQDIYSMTDAFGNLTVNKSGGTATLTADATLNNLVVTSGTFDAASYILIVNGTANVSGGVLNLNVAETNFYDDITVSGGTLTSSGVMIVLTDFIKTGGTCDLSGCYMYFSSVSMDQSLTTNEDLEINFIQHTASVNGLDLTFIGSGGTRTITVNEFVRRNVSHGVLLSSAVLAYAANGLLKYWNTLAMTAGAGEFPSSGGPDRVEFNGSHNLTIPFSRTVNSFELNGSTSKTVTLSGTLTTTNLVRRGTAGGAISGTVVYASDSTLTYYGGDTIIGPEWPTSDGPESCVIYLTSSSNRCESAAALPGITRTLTKDFTGVIGILDMGGNDANGILYVEGVVDQRSGFSLEDTVINPSTFDFANCLAFDGANDYCLRTVTGETTFDNKTELEIYGWIFIPTGMAANRIIWWYGNNGTRDLIIYNEAKSGSLHQLALYCHPNNSTWRTAKTGYVVTENAWHFVVFTFNGAGATDADKVKCKIDDASQSLTFAGGGFPTALPEFSTGVGTMRMVFGANFNLNVQLWAGRLDHFAFYFGLTDDATKTALYNSGAGADYALYNLLYKFDGTGMGTTLDDEGALNRDMTLTNFSFDGSTSGWRTHV